MLPNLTLIDFFKNLPYLALKEVSKYLVDRDRVLLSVISPKWEQSISSKELDGSVEKLVATVGNFEMKVKIHGVSPNFPPPLYPHYETTHMTFHFINSDTDKEVITEEIEPVFSHTTHFNRSIIVYRKNWEVDGNQRILEIARLLKLKFQLNLPDVTIDNATWMKQNDLLSLKFETTRIGDNQLTDKDFNAFLHSWMAGNHEKVRSYSFKVGDDMKIDQVIRGLITENWDPAKRDRKFIPLNNELVIQPLIDMADGYDFTRPGISSDKNLATVHITDNTLHFVVWDKTKSFERELKTCKFGLTVCNRKLSRDVPGTDEWNRITETRNKYLEEYRNLTEDPQAVYLEKELVF